jgi:hypothetical protein
MGRKLDGTCLTVFVRVRTLCMPSKRPNWATSLVFDKRASDRLLHMDEIDQETFDGYLSARGRWRRTFLQASGFMGALAAVLPWFGRLAHGQSAASTSGSPSAGGRVHVVPSTKETVRLGNDSRSTNLGRGAFQVPGPSTHGTQRPKPMRRACPQLARADVRGLGRHSGFDPGCVKTHFSVRRQK